MSHLPAISVSAKGAVSKKRNRWKLTESQESFARIIAYDCDLTGIDAYLLAYPNFDGTRKTAGEAASRLWNKPEVQERVQMLRNVFVAKCPMTKGEALTVLAEIARGDSWEVNNGESIQVGDPDTRIRAIRQMQTMIPEWTDSGSDSTPPESVQITIVTESRDRPIRVLNDTTQPIDVQVIDDE